MDNKGLKAYKDQENTEPPGTPEIDEPESMGEISLLLNAQSLDLDILIKLIDSVFERFSPILNLDMDDKAMNEGSLAGKSAIGRTLIDNNYKIRRVQNSLENLIYRSQL